MKTYSSYVWRDGIPYGVGQASEGFRLLADSYNKRISVERHNEHGWIETIYDSALLDFRQLKPEFQHGWEAFRIEESEQSVITQLHDDSDRIVALEHYRIEEGRSVSCEIRSPQGTLLATQELFYTDRGAAFNGAVLRDAGGFVVRHNRYDSPSFENLLADYWDMRNHPLDI